MIKAKTEALVHKGQLLTCPGVGTSGKTSLSSLYWNLTFKDQQEWTNLWLKESLFQAKAKAERHKE